MLIIIGQLPPISSLTRKTASTCSEDECEETEADESDGGLVRVGRVLGTFCLECLMMMITIMMMVNMVVIMTKTKIVDLSRLY